MVADDIFYKKFRNWLIGTDAKVEEQKLANQEEKEIAEGNGHDAVQEKSHRVTFLMEQLDIIPADVRLMYTMLMRAFPTSPLYLLLELGTIGMNVACYLAVRWKSAHVKNVIRTGVFYKFLAPSRFGRGMVFFLRSGFMCSQSSLVVKAFPWGPTVFVSYSIRGGNLY